VTGAAGPTSDGVEHLSADTAGDLDEGLLAPSDEAVARAHATACPACAALLADLRDVRRLLAADDPGPLPESVAARMRGALADRRPLTPLPPLPRNGPRRRYRAGLGLAAGVVTLAALGLGVALLGHQPSTMSGGGSALSPAGSPYAGRAGQSSSGSSSSGSVASGAGRGGGSGASRVRIPSPQAADAGGAGEGTVTYATTPDGLLQQVRTLLTASEPAAPLVAVAAACSTVLGPPAPVLVRPGTLRGRPSVLVVQRHGSTLVATVLADPCTPADARSPLLRAVGGAGG